MRRPLVLSFFILSLSFGSIATGSTLTNKIGSYIRMVTLEDKTGTPPAPLFHTDVRKATETVKPGGTLKDIWIEWNPSNTTEKQVLKQYTHEVTHSKIVHRELDIIVTHFCPDWIPFCKPVKEKAKKIIEKTLEWTANEITGAQCVPFAQSLDDNILTHKMITGVQLCSDEKCSKATTICRYDDNFPKAKALYLWGRKASKKYPNEMDENCKVHFFDTDVTVAWDGDEICCTYTTTHNQQMLEITDASFPRYNKYDGPGPHRCTQFTCKTDECREKRRALKEASERNEVLGEAAVESIIHALLEAAE